MRNECQAHGLPSLQTRPPTRRPTRRIDTTTRRACALSQPQPCVHANTRCRCKKSRPSAKAACFATFEIVPLVVFRREQISSLLPQNRVWMSYSLQFTRIDSKDWRRHIASGHGDMSGFRTSISCLFYEIFLRFASACFFDEELKCLRENLPTYLPREVELFYHCQAAPRARSGLQGDPCQ